MRRILYFIFTFATILIFSDVALANTNTNTHKIIVSYWSNGKMYRDYPMPGSIDTNGHIQKNTDLQSKVNDITILAYAFLQVDKNGNVYFQSPEIDLSKNDIKNFCDNHKPSCQNIQSTYFLGNFDAFSKLHNSHQDLKKIISIGGAFSESTFLNAVNNPDNFINSLNGIIHHFGLDGVDLDFELNNVFTKSQAKKYAMLISELRKKLGQKYYISVEMPGDNATSDSI